MWVWPLTLSDAANPNDSSPGRSTPVSSNAYVEAQRAHDRQLKKQHLEQRQLDQAPAGSLPARESSPQQVFQTWEPVGDPFPAKGLPLREHPAHDMFNHSTIMSNSVMSDSVNRGDTHTHGKPVALWHASI